MRFTLLNLLALFLTISLALALFLPPIQRTDPRLPLQPHELRR
jgi:competence protein ComGC